MQKKILIRDGDIAFVLAATFILGVAAATFIWNIVAILSILFLGSLAAIYYFNSKKAWLALVAVLLIFIFAVGYCHFLTPAKSQTASTWPQQKPGAGAAIFSSATFGAVLPAEQSELLSAIMSGSTSAVDPDLKSQMSASGTSYIVGMYGYKINLFAAAILGAGKRLFSRRVALIVVAIAVVAFIFAAGAPTTAIRAGIMIGLVFLAQASGRKFHVRNIFTFTAAAMLLFDPTLLGDAGFQLSFLSLLGIFVLGPPLKRIFRSTGHDLLEWKSHAIMALSVNAAIMPIVMLQFGDFSITSFASNFLIAIPLAVVIGLALAIIALGFLSPHLAFLAGATANIFLSYQLWVIKLFSTVVVPLPAIFQSMFFIALYYFILVAFTIYYGKEKNETPEHI
jgi:competence protein ComEC